MTFPPSTASAAAAAPGTKLLPHQSQPFTSIIKDKSSQKLITTLSLRLRRGQLSGPEAVSEATAKALRSVVSSAKYASMQELIDIIKAAGRELQLSQPAEQTIGNVTRRVVHLLREEAKAALLEQREKEAEARGGGGGSGVASLANSISDLTLANAFGGGSPSAIPPTNTHVQSPTTSAPNSTNSIPQVGTGRGSLSRAHSQFPSTSSSSGGAGALTRPGPHPLRHASEGSSAFVHGSFSISDLVAAGAMASSSTSSLAHTPADGSISSTPYAPLSRRGSGTFTQLREEPEAEAQAELDDASPGLSSDESSDDEDEEGEELEEEEEAVVGSAAKKAGAGAYFLKPLLIQAIQDLIDELETVDDNISKVSRDHIHSGEVILTLGSSSTVQSFFAAAAKDRKFTVIVPETAPSYTGHHLARSLSKLGISVLLIPDSSIFAVMPRVSKVVLGAHAVLANGGLISPSGAFATALAAKQHSTPVVILTGVYKVCPEWSAIQGFAEASTVGAMGPSALLDYATSSRIVEQAEVVSSAYDYVPPELVDVFITNVGEHPPSYVYRLVKENYHPDDIVL